MRNLSKDAWYKVSQAILLITMGWLVCQPISAFIHADSLMKAKQLEQVAPVDQRRMRNYLESARSILNGPEDSQFYVLRPEYYFNAAAYIDWTSVTLQRFLREHPKEALLLDDVRPFRDNFAPQKLALEQRYAKRFGREKMLWAAQYVKDTHAERNYAFVLHKPVVENRSLDLFLHGILPSIFIMFLFFGTRLKRQNKMRTVELPRWIAASIVWPLAMFVYPTRINPLNQAKMALKFVVYTLTALLSGSPAAFAKATAGARAGESSDASGHTLVLTLEDIPKISLTQGFASSKIAPNGAVFHSGPITSWSVNAAFSGGWSATFAGTRAFAGSPASDENDWMLSKSFPVGNDALTLGAAFYDILPLASTKGGDMLGLSAGYTHPVAGFTLFGFGEYDPLTEHGKAGYVVQIGERRSFDLGGGFTLAESASVVHGDGPFSYEAGTLGRLDLSVSKPVADGLTFSAWLKGMIPFQRFSDRSADAAVGVSLSYALN